MLAPSSPKQPLAPRSTSLPAVCPLGHPKRALWPHVQGLTAPSQAPHHWRTRGRAAGQGDRLKAGGTRGQGSAGQCPGHFCLPGVSPAADCAPAVLPARAGGRFVILNSTAHMTGVCFLNSFPLNSLRPSRGRLTSQLMTVPAHLSSWDVGARSLLLDTFAFKNGRKSVVCPSFSLPSCLTLCHLHVSSGRLKGELTEGLTCIPGENTPVEVGRADSAAGGRSQACFNNR